MSYHSTAQAKMPELLEKLEELNKAIETVRITTGHICAWLQLNQDEKATGVNALELKPTLIGGRIKYLDNLRSNLYHINDFLEEILAAVKEI